MLPLKREEVNFGRFKEKAKRAIFFARYEAGCRSHGKVTGYDLVRG